MTGYNGPCLYYKLTGELKSETTPVYRQQNDQLPLQLVRDDHCDNANWNSINIRIVVTKPYDTRKYV